MSAIRTIDQGIRKIIFSLFWWFIDPLEQERLYGQLIDTLERNLDTTHPDKIFIPDNYEVLVNNAVFIKHSHSIKKLQRVLAERIQRYAADHDFEHVQPRIKLDILSSSTISKRKVDIRCWFSSDDSIEHSAGSEKEFKLEVIEGEGKGSTWRLRPGNSYTIGRRSGANICLPYDNISKNQATIHFVSEREIDIVDDGSANGTFIDDETERVNGRRRLELGNKIRFCQLDPIVVTLQEE